MILIEDEILFLSVPKNASMSVHYALEESDLNIEPAFNQNAVLKLMMENNPKHYRENNHKIKVHAHYTTASLYSMIGKKLPTIFIKRDYTERFISAFNYIFNFRIPYAYSEYPEMLEVLYNIDNEWIYKNLNKNIISNIILYESTDVESYNRKIDSLEDIVHKDIINSLMRMLKKEIKVDIISPFKQPFPKNRYINFKMLDSQEIYKSGYTPEYIFDINELYKLENFLKNRYEKTIKIDRINEMDKKNIKTKITNDSKLKEWVWNNFEKHHYKKKLF